MIMKYESIQQLFHGTPCSKYMPEYTVNMSMFKCMLICSTSVNENDVTAVRR